jgi:hypothetical protein
MLQGMVAILEVHWVLKAIDSQLEQLKNLPKGQ